MKAFPLYLAALVLLIVSCAVVPESGRRQVNFISPQQEMRMGLSEFSKLKRSKSVSRDPQLNAVVSKIASRLTKVISLPGAQWEFVVFNDPSPNAFALPGGKVGVNTGLFPVAQTEGGLAAVIGHEIAHVVAHHGGERMSRQLGASLLGVALDAYLRRDEDRSNSDRRKILAAYGAGATVGVVLPHSRMQELEADKLGAIYMTRAGYNPQEAVDLWMRMANYKDRNGKRRKPAFLSTHPLDGTRIRALQNFINSGQIAL